MKKDSVFKLTWPIFVELILATLVGNVDQYMLSSYSQNAVAAVGNANQIMNLLILLFNVINLSTTILASQYIGSFQKRKTETVYTLAVLMNVIFSVFVSLVLLIFGRTIFNFMHVPAELMDDALSYLWIVGGFIFLQGMYTAFSAIFKTRKMVMYTMYISIAINVVNVGGNLLLINGWGAIPAFGASGAAISTVLSRLIGLVMCIVILLKRTDIRIKREYIRPFPHNELRKMLGIGLPSAGENAAYSFSQTVILRIVNAFGVYVINAKVYVSMFQWISVLYSAALAQVTQIFVSRLIGARDLKAANHRIGKDLLLSVTSGTCLAIGVFFIGDKLVSLFTTDLRTIELAKTLFFIDIFLQFGKCGNVSIVRSLQATGDTKFPVFIGIIVMLTVACGGSYILGVVCNLGLVGVWISMAADEIIRAVIFFIRWRSGAWKKYNLLS